uniref:R3-R13 n=1 Tax=Tritonia tetraquetra TaxID=2780533 RepID=I1SKH7_9GAST|nr:R3-R13 precursor [Tritonia tetraquetra]
MDLLRVCIVLTLCVAMMTQAVLSAPAFGQDLDTIDDSQLEMDPELAVFRERRDLADVDDESPELLSRLRRQVAQMDNGRRRYGSHGHRRRGRFHSRRLYQSRRTYRARGRVTDW